MSDVTQILQQIDSGDPSAAEELLPLVYGELRNLAAAKMVRESPDHTLQATALVHEAYVRLVDGGSDTNWHNRRHFFAAAAEAMRRILVESARRKSQLKSGGNHERVPLVDLAIASEIPLEEILTVDDALNKLDERDANAAAVAKLRYFAGMTLEEAAAALGVSPRSASRDWAYARAFLYSTLRDGDDRPTV